MKLCVEHLGFTFLANPVAYFVKWCYRYMHLYAVYDEQKMFAVNEYVFTVASWATLFI